MLESEFNRNMEHSLQFKLRHFGNLNNHLSEGVAMQLAADRIDELERRLAESKQNEARYKYLRDIDFLPLRVYDALENNMGETLDMEIDYAIGMKVAEEIQAK